MIDKGNDGKDALDRITIPQDVVDHMAHNRNAATTH